MKISLNWLKKYIPINESPKEIGELLTMTGLEVETIKPFESINGGLEGLIVGEVLTCVKHPNADKLKIAKVNLGGSDPVQIICGAPNIDAGQKVIVATVGTMVHPTLAEPFKISKAKIRGEFSEGMICSEAEISLGNDHNGIIVLDGKAIPGSSVKDYYELETDQIFEIGLTPNRNDATSHIGTARDLKAVLKRDVTWPEVNNFSVDNTEGKIMVEVKDPIGCPRYSGINIKNVKVDESPQWLKNKLMAIGLNPVNNVVDITNFVLHETGQPLHVFDAAKIKGNKILVKTLKKGTIFKTLDEVDRKLDTNDLMICDGEDNGMCIAGVFGGIDSGIDTDSNDLFLESAYFSPDYIRKTAQAHSLMTDASFRFERGTDPNLTVYALKRTALLIKEIAGGEIASEIIDIYPTPVENFKIDILFNHVDRLIGKSIPKERIFEILKLLDIEVLQYNTEGFSVSVPPYRADVTREADIIEEILRIYGFNNIELPENVGASSLAEFPQIDPDKIRLKVSNYLVGKDFYEVWNNSLTKPEYLSILGNDSSSKVEILNKLSEDVGVMRQSLMFSGLENISYNINRKQEDLKLFEFGKIYFKKDSGYSELQKLSLFLTGNKKKENWHEPSQQVDIYDLKKFIKGLATKLADYEISFKNMDYPEYSYSLEINYNQENAGKAGKISPNICSQFGIEKEIFYAELDWDLLLQNANDNIVLEEVSKYPEVRRDLSLVLDKQVSFEEIRALTQQLENQLIKEINVFDVYEGENLGTHKKAYALSFILQDNKKTLTDKIIDKTMNRLMKNFEEKLGAIIRK